MTTDLTCETNHSSAGPLYYVPQLNTSWLYSTTAAAYTAYEDSIYLIVKDLDCNLKHSRPVFCALKEGTGEWSPRGYLHPHTLCKLEWSPRGYLHPHTLCKLEWSPWGYLHPHTLCKFI